MTLLLRFRSEDLLRCRFAISPLMETADALRSLSNPRAQSFHLPWRRRARELLPGLALGPLQEILAVRGYQPDFMNPPPDSPFTEIGAELDRVRATEPDKVAAEMARCTGLPAGSRLRDRDPAAVRDLLADQLARAWSALIEPWWPRLRDVHDADITYRARRLADAGLAAVLGELGPQLSYAGDAIRFNRLPRTREPPQEIDVSGTELVLVPGVFVWPSAAVGYDPPAVCYPARGIDGLWSPGPRSGEDLVRLIGRTRATLLMALAEPASTTGLSARTGTPVSSVSEHLSVLRDSGLVTTVRTGRFLLHRRTPLGLSLSGD